MAEKTVGELHDKHWGAELWIANNEKYCGKKLILNKGFQCSLHYHQIKHETFFVQSGKVYMEYGEIGVVSSTFHCIVMNPGDIIVIEPWITHRFTGIEDSEIFEFSTQHFEDDSYRGTLSRQLTSKQFEELLSKINELN